MNTLAGNGSAGFADGAGTAARFNNPTGVAIDDELDRIWVTGLWGVDVIEVGTLAGYSAIAMARALPEGGKVRTIELETEHADFAEESALSLAAFHRFRGLRLFCICLF